MIYQRKIQTEIEKQMESREIIVITGMRRVGKTTLMKSLYDKIESDNKVFLDLENMLDQKIFDEEDFNNVLKNLEAFQITVKKRIYLFIDEIQEKPSIVKIIKYLYDHYDMKIFLTGSSSFYLKNLFPESLAGRKFIFELFPLDFQEFLVFKQHPKPYYPTFREKDQNKNLVFYEKFKNSFDEYLEFGGFPQVVLTEAAEQKQRILQDIFSSYFAKDVSRLSDFRNVNILKNLILLLIQRIGSKLDVSKLASELGVSRDTVYSYLSFLESTYFISLIRPYSTNVDREISGTRKVYLCDNGFASQFGKVDRGSLFENAIFHSLRNFNKVMYYQKRTGVEIDFVLPKQKISIEGKLTGTPIDYQRLSRISKSLGINEYYVISHTFRSEPGIIPAVEL